MKSRSNVVPIYRADERHPQAQQCMACEVRRLALFGALSDDALDHIHTYIDHLDLRPDQTLFDQGEKGLAVFTVRSGMLRFERLSEGGTRRIVRLAGVGDLIGQEALVSASYRDRAVAVSPVALCRIPVSLIESLGRDDPAVQRELLVRLQKALDDSEIWLADLAQGSARRRVLGLFVKLSRYLDGTGLAWMPRREDIGAMLGITIETASRQISQLRRQALIELVSARAVRLDAAGLHQAFAACEA